MGGLTLVPSVCMLCNATWFCILSNGDYCILGCTGGKKDLGTGDLDVRLAPLDIGDLNVVSDTLSILTNSVHGIEIWYDWNRYHGLAWI